MAIAVTEAGADKIGTNCGQGLSGIIGIVKELRSAATAIPIIVQANAGLPQNIKGKTVFPETPKGMASFVPELINAGANIIGGCCGITPKHIREIVSAVGVMQRSFP